MSQEEKKESPKGFWANLVEKIDKAMQAKANSSCCCCGPESKNNDKKCC